MITTFEDGIQLTNRFQDCECEENYIHPSSKDKCPICGAERDTQPDSRTKEVVDQFGKDTEL